MNDAYSGYCPQCGHSSHVWYGWSLTEVKCLYCDRAVAISHLRKAESQVALDTFPTRRTSPQ